MTSILRQPSSDIAQSKTSRPLRMWRDLTPLPFALNKPIPSSPRVLIIGGGVTGLATAWLLLDQGKEVVVVSKQWASHAGERLTSQIAGALWEYPPAVCGQHEGNASQDANQRWSLVSYHCWAALAEDPEIATASGVKMRPAGFFFPDRLEDDPLQYQKMEETIAGGIQGFRRGAHIAKEYGVNSDINVKDAYEILSPIVDTDQGMQWLMKLVQDKGAHFVTETIKGDLLEQEDALRQRFAADIIINATGLGALELAADETCYPVRGALVRVINDGVKFPKLESALVLSPEMGKITNEIYFIVPRNDNILLLGGIADPKESDMELTLNSPIIQRMRERCYEFLPALRDAELHPSYPLAIGLRPFRGSNVRVEREQRQPTGKSDCIGARKSRIIHSYGHGGAGWTLAFGCAADCSVMIDELLEKTPVRRGLKKAKL